MVSHIASVQDFFHRQYEMDDGGSDALSELFSEKLVYHLPGGRTMSRSGLALMAGQIRSVPRQDRRVVVTDLHEEGNLVAFHLDIRANDPETAEPLTFSGEQVWRFDSHGRVVEIWPTDSYDIEREFAAIPQPRPPSA